MIKKYPKTVLPIKDNFVNAPPLSGTPATASQTPTYREDESGLASIMRGILGPAAGPVEGLLSLFDPRDIYKSLGESGQNLKEGVTTLDPKKLLLGTLGAAAVGAEVTPFGKPSKKVSESVDRVIKLNRQPTGSSAKSKEDWTKENQKKILTPPEEPIQAAKLFLQKRKDADEFLLDNKGDPVVVYHSTDSIEPFHRFLTRAERNELNKDSTTVGGYPFASTSSVPLGASPFGLTSDIGLNLRNKEMLLEEGYTENEILSGLKQGARLIPSLVKSTKVFDFENPRHIERIFKRHDQNVTKELAAIERVSEEGTSASEKFNVLIKDMSPKQKLNMKDNIDGGFRVEEMADELNNTGNITSKTKKAKTIFDKKGNILPEFQNNPSVLKALDRFLTRNSKDLGARINNKHYREEIKGGLAYGNYSELEDKNILKAMQDVGFDAFTTFEEGTKNVMLFKPDTQLIPLFDLDKKSAVGFNKGGSVVERNPYEDYTPRMI